MSILSIVPDQDTGMAAEWHLAAPARVLNFSTDNQNKDKNPMPWPLILLILTSYCNGRIFWRCPTAPGKSISFNKTEEPKTNSLRR